MSENIMMIIFGIVCAVGGIYSIVYASKRKIYPMLFLSILLLSLAFIQEIFYWTNK